MFVSLFCSNLSAMEKNKPSYPSFYDHYVVMQGRAMDILMNLMVVCDRVMPSDDSRRDIIRQACDTLMDAVREQYPIDLPANG